MSQLLFWYKVIAFVIALVLFALFVAKTICPFGEIFGRIVSKKFQVN